MRGTARIGVLLLASSLLLAAEVLLPVADEVTRQQTDIAEPPPAIRWYPVSGGFTPEAYTSTLDLGWLNKQTEK